MNQDLSIITLVLHASLVVVQQAWRNDTLLAEGSIRIGCVDAGTFRPRRIPSTLLDRLA